MATEDIPSSKRKSKITAMIFGVPVVVMVLFIIYSGYHKRSFVLLSSVHHSTSSASGVKHSANADKSTEFRQDVISSIDIDGHHISRPENSTGLLRDKEIIITPPLHPVEELMSPYCRSLISYKPTSTHGIPKSSSPRMYSQQVSSTAEIVKKTRILCWITTSPEYAKTRLPHVKNTWGPRCDQTLYFSSFADNDFPIIKLNVSEGHSLLWGKTKAAFKYIYEHHFDQFDWFLKADDDTYLIIENLRYLMSEYDTSNPIFLGHSLFNSARNTTFASGGAGYVLSKAALQRFVECGLNDSSVCSQRQAGREDVEIALCLKSLGVMQVDSRDRLGRQRFIPFDPWRYMTGHVAPWYYESTEYPYKKGRECCSNYVVSFHYVKPEEMQLLDYIIYDLRLYLTTGDGSFT